MKERDQLNRLKENINSDNHKKLNPLKTRNKKPIIFNASLLKIRAEEMPHHMTIIKERPIT